MISPIKFLSWVLGLVFALGLGDSFAHLTYEMGKAAIHAQVYDQISYTKFNRLLWTQKKSSAQKNVTVR